MTANLGRAVAGAVCWITLSASCSLSTTDASSCATHEECNSAFGAGYICADSGACELSADTCESHQDCYDRNGIGSVCGDGICQPLEVHPRCQKTYPEGLFSRPDRADYLVVGNLMDRSVSTHQARENSAELAVRQANAEGGLEGKQLGMVFCTIEESIDFDTLGRMDAAVASAEWLADAGVPAIVGPAASGDTGAVFEAVRARGVLVMSPSATSPALTSQDNTAPTDADPGLLWRTAPPDSLQGKVIAEDMLARGISQVAVINETGAYGDELVRVFEEELGLSLVQLVKYDDEAQIADAVVTVGQSGATEVLFVSSQTPHVVSFLNAVAATSSLDDKNLFLSDAAANGDVLSGAADAVFSRVRGTRPSAASGPVYSAFQAAYAAEFGGDVSVFSFTAHAYDAAWLVLYGMAYASFSSDEIRGPTIAQGLRRVSDPAGEVVELRASQWRTAVQAFRSESTLNVNGASGTLDFDPATEETSAPIEVWRISDDCAGGDEIEVIDLGATPPPRTCP